MKEISVKIMIRINNSINLISSKTNYLIVIRSITIYKSVPILQKNLSIKCQISLNMARKMKQNLLNKKSKLMILKQINQRSSQQNSLLRHINHLYYKKEHSLKQIKNLNLIKLIKFLKIFHRQFTVPKR